MPKAGILAKTRGGHGGLHSEEKIVPMLVSGPGVGHFELKSKIAQIADENGNLISVSGETYPSVVDATPRS